MRGDAAATVSVANDLEELERVNAMLSEFADQSGVSDGVRTAFLLVTEELLANTIRYGYDGGVQDTIEVTAEVKDGRPQLTLADGAKFYDITQPPRQPDEDVSLEDMEIGGLGLFLVHEYAEAISQTVEGGRNVTRITLKDLAE
ncbi:ATP-binding protein [Rhizobium sp. RU36D]|uniref:ATP-binding protein n=1 Tax=Rhizobium sp. RU36D TaxID=1907415 RepID=UPI0009D8E015|nr:ATP-binding protein [Rhizobium sp. RU36D]SMC65660.1 serine/threonine-protein kinase RsbW [Rhizobium sp. RU36D]